jgi:N utilization substance protein A
MKTEFVLAFNEIAEMRKLPRDIIMEALKAALVSAYRRSSGASSGQNVEARLDEKTGEPSIWVEKEVVETITSESTEVTLTKARDTYPDVELGDMVLMRVERTPRDFGRIAAQTAKQVILQRMREAEREAQYQEYMERVGDLVTGTVQSASSGMVTIGLGRTEAILPASQQMPGEHYKVHDKVRAYVMEVRKAPRGPQIVLSRTHRNMLRRLIEYEVPEIYNGIVEIKSIAREPGARSKVAVAARQEGADPVGACVGMRGVRIQSIVKELNNEKIDVIEWNADQAVFISKALSPARVSSVFLDDDPDDGRTAIVVVPDDQLSLAIGREGQNARLVAKLTGWRIDIKSIMEAADEALRHLQQPEAADLLAKNEELKQQIELIMQKRDENRPIMPEDYQLMVDFIKLVETHLLSLREEERAERRALREAARAQVPPAAYDYPLEETDLHHRIYDILADGGYLNVGMVMEQYYLEPNQFLNLRGFQQSMLESIEEMMATLDFSDMPVEEVIDEEALPAEIEAEEEALEEAGELEAGAVAEAVDEEEYAAATEEEELAVEEPAIDAAEAEARAKRAALVAEILAAEQALSDHEELPIETEEVLEAPAAHIEDEEMRDDMPDDFMDEDDLDDEFYKDMTDKEKEEHRRARQRRRQLVYDENLGEVVAKRRRKGSRHREEEDWDNYLDV